MSKKLKSSNWFIYVTSVCLLVLEYILIRFALFDLHGMKDMPFYMFLLSLSFVVVSYIANFKNMSIYSSIAYIIGYTVGHILETFTTDPGGGTLSNMWIIWVVSYFVILWAFIIFHMISQGRFKKKE